MNDRSARYASCRNDTRYDRRRIGGGKVDDFIHLGVLCGWRRVTPVNND